MSSSSGFLDFFILEANEYVEELDGVLSRGGISGPRPDVDALQRVSRALRGTATMAKLGPFADLAMTVERIGRGLHVGSISWEPALASALIATVDDFKILLRSARTWSAAEEQRAGDRIAELTRFAPDLAPTPTSSEATSSRGAAAPFLATEAANIAAGLELLTTRPADSTTASNVLGRVRALRGVAGVREIPALGDVLEATEEAARPLELRGEALSTETNALLHAAADLLRQLAATLRAGGDANAAGPELHRFVAAQDGWADREEQRERIVPIAELFYPDGAGVVEPASHPPTTMSERFRLELVSQGEHLRAMIGAARATPEAATSSRMRRSLKRALHSLQATAESFGEPMIASAIASYGDVAERSDEAGLATLDRVSGALAGASDDASALASQLRSILSPPIPLPVSSEAISFPLPLPAPEPSPLAGPVKEPIRAPMSQASPPSPDDFLAALDSSIAALHELELRPISQPVPTVEEALVPIESLLYRGRAALDRAVEVRDDLRRRGPTSDPEALEELFDLVELARAE
jgi:hypothetical protein